ncbi:MAG: hypothetical protein LAT67_12565 [Balneolales bacterium]|nr:hypothetical protein [Balneolales bacterium]
MYLNSKKELRDYLTFNENSEDPFWFGEGQVFELFFLADIEGPSDHQLNYYLDFQNNSIEYVDSIREKVIDAWEREKGEAPKRFYQEVPFVDIITINPEGSQTDMDIVLSFRTFKLLFYSRWTTYVAKFKGRKLTFLKTSRLYEKEDMQESLS